MRFAIYDKEGKWMFNRSATSAEEALENAKQENPEAHHAEPIGLDRNDAA